MTVNIIACGESAKHYDGSGRSIGVNDACRFKQPETLVILNTPNQFTEDRMLWIKKTETKDIYSNTPSSWERVIGKSIEPFNSELWHKLGKYQHKLYHSKTSPFAAISLAAYQGYSDIIIWGVDFVNHKVYKPGNGHYMQEYDAYKSFVDQLSKVNINVWRGHNSGNLDFIPVWQQLVHKQ